MGLSNIISEASVLLEMTPEELAGPLMQCINSLPPQEQNSQLNRYNYVNGLAKEYPQHKDLVSHALMEAWIWLEREGFLAPRPGPGYSGDWVFITRRGKGIQSSVDMKSFLHSSLLPKQQLHPTISIKVWSAFVRSEFDTAVFQAFKEVEVAVRIKGGYAAGDLGVGLMRKAFHPETGPLRDPSALLSERQALADLFSGAIGSYKNPSSHRHVALEASEAVEMIVLASHLLTIVDSRSPQSA